jgi:hypothetical protein
MSATKKFALWAIALLVVLHPVAILWCIRHYIADDPRADAAAKSVRPELVNAVYLANIKWRRWKERQITEPHLIIVGNSSSLVFSREVVREGLGCDIPVFNFGIHDADARAMSGLLAAMRLRISVDDRLLLVVQAQQMMSVKAGQNWDLYAPWVRGMNLFEAAVSGNRRQLIPVIYDRAAMRVQFDYFDSLGDLVRFGPAAAAKEWLSIDGSTKFADLEATIPDRISAGTHVPILNRQSGANALRQAAGWQPAQADLWAHRDIERLRQELKLINSSIKLQLQFPVYRADLSTSPDREIIQDFYRTSGKWLPEAKVLESSTLKMEPNDYLDDLHLSQDGAVRFLKSISRESRDQVCG